MFLQQNGKDHSTFYYKSKYTHKFHAFTIKTDLKNMSEIRELGSKKCSEIGSIRPTLSFSFPRKITVFKEKSFSIFYYKNRNIHKFYALKITVKSDFRNMTEN